MNDFVDNIDVPKSLLPDLVYIKAELERVIQLDRACPVYMCNCKVSIEFGDWMENVITDNTPRIYSNFAEERGIVALFSFKGGCPYR